MLHDHIGGRVGGILAANAFDEVALGVCTTALAIVHYTLLKSLTHQVEVDTVVHQIVFARVHVLRCAEVHPVLLAHVLDLVVRASQADNISVELLEIRAQHFGGIASGIACNKDRQEDVLALGSLLHLVNNLGHLVQFVGADIRAVREAEVNLIDHNQRHNGRIKRCPQTLENIQSCIFPLSPRR